MSEITVTKDGYARTVTCAAGSCVLIKDAECVSMICRSLFKEVTGV